MDDVFWVLVALGFGALMLAAPVLALIAYFKARSVDELVRRVKTLEARLDRLGERRASAPAEPRVQPAVAPQPAPAPTPIPLRPEPVIASVTPEPVEPPAPVEPAPPIARELPRAAATIESMDVVPETQPQPAAAASSNIDWERWIGVRGAAVLGGLFLALAGLLFFQYSIQRGWITPGLRCSLGAAVGVAAIVGASVLRKREYRSTADALTGAGATILYGAAWAARVLYELIPPPLAFAAMIAITVMCGWLAVRHASQTIAVFGLLGGFATPLLLGASSNQPLGLFGYLLMLDIGLVAIGRKRQWPMIALLATLATPLLFGLWVGARFDERHFLLALGFCVATATLFAVGGNTVAPSERRRWLASQVLALLMPLLFAIYFATRVQLETRLLPLAIALVVSNLVALWTARRQREPRLVLGAAFCGAAMLATWMLSSRVVEVGAWQLVAAGCALAAIAHVGYELATRRGDEALLSWATSANGAALAPLTVFVIGAMHAQATPLWPWLVGALAITSLFARQVALGAMPAIAIASYVGAASVVVGWIQTHANDQFAPLSRWTELCVFAALASFLLMLATVVRREGARAWMSWAVCAACVVLLVERGMFSAVKGWHPTFVVAEITLVAACGLLAAAYARSGAVFAVVALVTWLGQARFGFVLDATEFARPTLLWLTGTWIGVSALPFVTRERLGSSKLAWRAAAVACALWSLPIAALLARRFDHLPDSASLVVGFVLAALVAACVRANARAKDERGRSNALAVGFTWFASIAIAFASFAWSVEVDHAIDLVGIALLAAGLAVLARRLDHAGLRVLALIGCVYLLGRAPAEVLMTALHPGANPYETRSGWPVIHWLSYSVGVSALASFVVAHQLRDGGDQRKWLSQARACVSLLGILLVFLWLNVEVVNLFSHGTVYDFALQRLPARDVAMSVAWAAFALVLLVLAVKWDRMSLRWTSLAFFLATIAKAFLYDMGALRGLYRVGALVGLAFALLIVSLLYQRFVFRIRAPATSSPQ